MSGTAFGRVTAAAGLAGMRPSMTAYVKNVATVPNRPATVAAA